MIKSKFKNVIIVVIIGLMIAGGCRNYNAGIPENAVKVVPTDTLIQMLYDIHIIDAIILSKIIDLEDYDIDSLMYDAVFDKYSYSKNEFENTLLYYTHFSLDSLSLIYSKVMDKLHQEKGEIMQL